MNLDFSAEQKALKEELRRLLAARHGLQSARAALDGARDYDAALWRELGGLGWLATALPEEYGGQALGYETLCCVAEEAGRSMAALPLIPSIFLAAEAILLFGSAEQKSAFLPALGAGETIGAFAIAEVAGPLVPRGITAHYEDGVLTGSKTSVAAGMIADVLITVALENGEPQLFIVDAKAPGVVRSRQTGVDPSQAIAGIRFHGAAAAPLGAPGWVGVRALLDRAAVLVAFVQLGAADAALEFALSYARERTAFGRVIGSFQAIKHKLADVWAANELARSNAYYAAWALQSGADVLPLAAATARVAATEALERAARELIQVHGGVAVTWAHDAHLFYRRGQHLALLLGGLREWQDQVTARLALAA